MADFTIKQGDRLPTLRVTCQDANGTAVDVTGATVEFHMTNQSTGALVVNAAGTLVTPASGIVEYQWAAGDTDTAGDYWAEFEVTFASGKQETFPNNRHIHVLILAQLA